MERLGRNRQLKPSGANGAVVTALDIHTVFEKPLLKCAVVMALAAIVHGLVAYGHSGMLQPLLAASVLAAMTLLLTARNVQGLDRITEARTLVYIGCLAASVGALAATTIVWNRDALAPTAAAMSVVLAVIGLVLMEAPRQHNDATRKLNAHCDCTANPSHDSR